MQEPLLTILRLGDVKSRTGLSKSTIYQLMAEGRFPATISLGGRCVGWIESEIDSWLREQVRMSRGELEQ